MQLWIIYDIFINKIIFSFTYNTEVNKNIIRNEMYVYFLVSAVIQTYKYSLKYRQNMHY